MSARKKKAVRRKVVRRKASTPFGRELAQEVERIGLRFAVHEERRSRSAERMADALEVLAQYVADYATRDRVARMAAFAAVNPPERPYVFCAECGHRADEHFVNASFKPRCGMAGCECTGMC